ncbi:hypothetical protein Avbf_17154 [Armadillidium vulgare]|nr:hypothetical protein Avbf_17154 [Armadillidium vulgare]
MTNKKENSLYRILDAQSNTYATIQKSHGGTLRSLQLRELQRGSTGTLNLGEDPGESNDYATLDHLKTASNSNLNRQGPRVPGVETPSSAVFVHERESPEIKELVTSFTGSTFQPPDGTNMANRPLPEEPLEGRRYSKGSIGHAFDERNKNLLMRNTFHCSCDALLIKIERSDFIITLEGDVLVSSLRDRLNRSFNYDKIKPISPSVDKGKNLSPAVIPVLEDFSHFLYDKQGEID